MKIVFCSSEVVPFAKTGGLADVCGTLPIELQKLGEEVVVILPKYKAVDLSGFTVERPMPGVAAVRDGSGVRFYFIENEKLYGRDGIYGGAGGDYPDNLERFQFYCARSLELLKAIDFKADIVHCHDWQTGIIPAFLKFRWSTDPFYKAMKSILTIHNLAYQGWFPAAEFPKLGFDLKLFKTGGFEAYDQINLLKTGLTNADKVTTVSPTYAREIMTKELGCGLEAVLAKRPDSVTGILNGLDYTVWNPQSDALIERSFSAQNPDGKKVNKASLQKKFGFPVRADIPVIGFVGRLSYQKGLDLIEKSIDGLMASELQLIFLGVGDEKYQQELAQWSKKFPQKIAVELSFSEQQAHRIYAGSDLFLMPSVYEPCGLSQMISLRYGTVPIVHKTGGLADTIHEFNAATGEGNGFVFDQYEPVSFLKAVGRALAVFQDQQFFKKLADNAFACDFSWERSAQEYRRVYQSCSSSA